MRELTVAEKDNLIETLTSSAMGYERAVVLVEELDGSDGDLLAFCAENNISSCTSCDWYCEADELIEDQCGDLVCRDCCDEQFGED